MGDARLQLKRNSKAEMEDVYVVHHLHTALLGRSVSCRLQLVVRLDIETLRQTYPELCSGLGELRQSYTIKLKSGAQPLLLKTPRKIPMPLIDRVKRELFVWKTLE